MFKISRKTMVIALMVVLLLVTGLLNWKYISNEGVLSQDTSNGVADGEDVETSNFFSTYKSERMTNREEEMTKLEIEKD